MSVKISAIYNILDELNVRNLSFAHSIFPITIKVTCKDLSYFILLLQIIDSNLRIELQYLFVMLFYYPQFSHFLTNEYKNHKRVTLFMTQILLNVSL